MGCRVGSHGCGDARRDVRTLVLGKEAMVSFSGGCQVSSWTLGDGPSHELGAHCFLGVHGLTSGWYKGEEMREAPLSRGSVWLFTSTVLPRQSGARVLSGCSL